MQYELAIHPSHSVNITDTDHRMMVEASIRIEGYVKGDYLLFNDREFEKTRTGRKIFTNYSVAWKGVEVNYTADR